MGKQKAPIYQVEAIVGKKTLKGKPFYLVKWEGYDANQNTWEPYENLKECKEVVDEYEKMFGKEEPLGSPKSAKRRRSKPAPPQPQPASSGRSTRRSDAAKPARAESSSRQVSPRPESPVEVVKVEASPASPVKRARTESSSSSSSPPAAVSKDSPKPAKRLRSSRELSASAAKPDRVSPCKSTDDETTQVLPSTSTCSSEAESSSDVGHRAVCLLSTFRDRRNRLLFVFELDNGAFKVVDAQTARRQHRQTVMDFLMNEAS